MRAYVLDSFDPQDEERWSAFEPTVEELNILRHPAGPAPGFQNTEQSVSSEDSTWLPTPAEFSADCISLKRWTSSSRSLLLLGDAPRQSLSKEQCLCDIAMANLQLHRKIASNIAATSALEICLHFQRLVHWTRGVQKDCQDCLDDDLVKFVMAGIADQVVAIYRTVIEDTVKDQQGIAGGPAGNQPSAIRLQAKDAPFEKTTVFFGAKAIEGSTKIAFLGRLIGLKLQQIGLLLEEFQKRKQPEMSKDSGQPLQLLVSESLERLSITTGILSMLE